MKVGSRTNLLTQVLYRPTAFGLHLTQCCQVGKMLVDQRFVRQWPQPFSRLQFWRVGRQPFTMQPFWDDDFLACVPSSIVFYQDNLLVPATSHRRGKLLQRSAIGAGVDLRHQQPKRFAAVWTDKSVEIQPLVAVLNRHTWSPAFERPYFPKQRFETNPMLVHTPQFDLRLGVLSLHITHDARELFLNASCAAASALAWRGRGVCRLKPSRLSHSQPRATLTFLPRLEDSQSATFWLVHTPPSAGGSSSAARSSSCSAAVKARARPGLS